MSDRRCIGVTAAAKAKMRKAKAWSRVIVSRFGLSVRGNRAGGARSSQALHHQHIEPAVPFSFRALRHQSARETRAARTQCRLGEREMDEVALSEAAAAAMRDAAHARQPFDAPCIITADEGEQRLAERRRECLLRKR